MTPPNDNTPPDAPEAKVVELNRPTADAIRLRLAAQEKNPQTRAFPAPGPLAGVEDMPEIGSFEVLLHTGEVLNYEGYLVATSVFVGFADEEGVITGVVPMANIRYVIPVEFVDILPDDAD